MPEFTSFPQLQLRAKLRTKRDEFLLVHGERLKALTCIFRDASKIIIESHKNISYSEADKESNS